MPEKDGGGQPATDSEESVAENPSSSSGLKRPAAAVEQEVEEESDAYNGLQVAAINALQLPRLRGKQTPKGKWTRMRVPAWVQERLAEDFVVGEQDVHPWQSQQPEKFGQRSGVQEAASFRPVRHKIEPRCTRLGPAGNSACFARSKTSRRPW